MNFLENHTSISVAPLWLWEAFLVGIIALLVIDLLIFGKSHKVTTKFALLESGLWISVALLFNGWIYYYMGHDLGIEFLSSYLIEKSLSIDNLFVIMLVFSSYKIPDKYQHKILFYGILGAVVSRSIFIILGVSLIQKFSWVLYLFGVFLVYTSLKMLFEKEEKNEEIKAEEKEKEGKLTSLVSKFIKITKDTSSGKFFTKVDGKLAVTPLFLCLLMVEFSDIVFAVDSIPAVFAMTQDGFIAFSSNILAVLGLRALYFVLSDLTEKITYLKYALSAILFFIGFKLLLGDLYHVSTLTTLIVIGSVFTVTIIASVLKKS